MAGKKLIASGEVARMLGLTKQAVADLRNRGKLRGMPIPRLAGGQVDYGYDIDEVIELKRARAAKRLNKKAKDAKPVRVRVAR